MLFVHKNVKLLTNFLLYILQMCMGNSGLSHIVCYQEFQQQSKTAQLNKLT